MLTPVQQSQHGTPEFIISKKVGTLSFITDYRSINQKLFRKPYPLSIIGKTIQKLEVFQYATALDINMVYYTIRISPTTQYMKTIVIEFGKFRYNHLSMGICASGDIFQAKVDELLGDIEGVKMYINDIIVFSKNSFEKNI